MAYQIKHLWPSSYDIYQVTVTAIKLICTIVATAQILTITAGIIIMGMEVG